MTSRPSDRAPRRDAPYTIVVGIDYSELGDAALAAALRIAQGYERAEVHPVYVERDFREDPLEAAAIASDAPTHAASALDKLDKHAQTRFRQYVAELPAPAESGPPYGLRRLVSHVRLGAPARQVVQLAVDLDADLIVLGTHGRRGFDRLVMGSVAERVLRTARCPVFVVRPKNHENASEVPEIEPACPQCLAARAASGGKEMWCQRHASRVHLRPHRYSFTNAGEIAPDSSRFGGQT
ncbi:MAG: universal stress protein [Polyangiaceae bacterium]|nr:universal stress protein [Polyangiaceae bacterium]